MTGIPAALAGDYMARFVSALSRFVLMRRCFITLLCPELMGHAQIGIDHFLVAAYLVRCAIADLATVIEYDHAV